MNLVAAAFCLVCLIAFTDAHARLADPVARGSYWRTDDETYPFTESYDFTEEYEFCFDPEPVRNAKCGVCGPIYNNNPAEEYSTVDSGETLYLASFERANPVFRNVQNSIQKTYTRGQQVQIKLDVEFDHLGGAVEFRIASADGSDLIRSDPSQADFNKNQLRFTNGRTTMDLNEAVKEGVVDSHWYEETNFYVYDVVLPQNLTCKHCVLQWTWVATDFKQVYMGCSDIRITA